MLTHNCPIGTVAVETDCLGTWEKAFFPREHLLQFVREAAVDERLHAFDFVAAFFDNAVAFFDSHGADADFYFIRCFLGTLHAGKDFATFYL